MLTPKNARGRPVTKLCLALETYRRTDEGRVRDAKAFLGHFFPQGKDGAVDRLFIHIPNEVRADLLSNWGIRGKKSALRDDDERVRATVSDALGAGDIDATVIEEGVTPEILIDWVPLDDWWSFWRGALLPVTAARKVLAVARELALFDERWFFENLALKMPKLVGTDVVCSALSKDQIVAWVRAVHASGDASPAGLVAAVGWDTVLLKTAHDALLHAVDALARQIGLADSARKSDAPPKPMTSDVPVVAASAPAPIQPPPPPARPPSVPPRPTPSKPAPSEGSKPPSARPHPPAVSRPPRLGQPLASVIVEPEPPAAEPTRDPDPFASSRPPPPRPVSNPPTARALFGAPDPHEAAPPAEPPPAASPAGPALPSVHPRAGSVAGIGLAPLFGTTAEEVAGPSFDAPVEDPPWAPPRAEPGDMGWDIVYGVKRSMGTSVQPRYNFGDDDEPTSEIAVPTDPRRGY